MPGIDIQRKDQGGEPHNAQGKVPPLVRNKITAVHCDRDVLTYFKGRLKGVQHP